VQKWGGERLNFILQHSTAKTGNRFSILGIADLHRFLSFYRLESVFFWQISSQHEFVTFHTNFIQEQALSC